MDERDGVHYTQADKSVPTTGAAGDFHLKRETEDGLSYVVGLTSEYDSKVTPSS
ncbi:hypothetical protein FRB94_013020 [Tulasnella sp. JGI-2019a]|nr:hypothetical protein FRB93_010349 [Tulasnella sp. JGI-2019a]KAG8990877.1 hypothetical protein FRB94_013020 [Tulasnella sp. JGI-2019a]KAG9024123.1 hypothetical protein FRB95_012058 [Tulasnella sp. JGI-2019a]